VLIALGLGDASMAGAAPPARSAAPASLAKLAPDLLSERAAPDTVTVWVGFSDKGESSPADLAFALADARAALSPRALARRERAGVHPLVDERDVPVSRAYLDALEARGLRPFAVSRWLNRAAVRVPGTGLSDVAALPFVERLTSVARLRRSLDPAAPATPRPSGALRPEPPPGASAAGATPNYGLAAAQLDQINLPAVHDSGYVGTGILVCILDDGFNRHGTHEALKDQIIAPGHQRDFIRGVWDVTDSSNVTDFDHGSAVMGCIGGLKPGVYMGAAFGASFALGRTEYDPSETQVEMLYWGMGAEWADSLGADIITSSLGYFTFDAPPNYSYADMDGHTTEITRYAEVAASKGILVVNAVGNEGDQTWHWLVAPADVNGDSLIAVGAVDDIGVPATFTSYGPRAGDGQIKPDLAARGFDTPVVWPPYGDQGYESLNGTSFSTPLVAGLAACLMQARPAWRPVEVIQALRASASQVASPDVRVGYGIPDGARALCWQPANTGVPSMPPVGTARVIGPNPARAGGPPVRVLYSAGGFIPGSNPGRVHVLDLMGRRVRDLWSGALVRGQCLDVSWDGRDDERRVVHSGYYFLSLDVGGEVTTARVAWLR
jgi:subtilisin family serine protease